MNAKETIQQFDPKCERVYLDMRACAAKENGIETAPLQGEESSLQYNIIYVFGLHISFFRRRTLHLMRLGISPSPPRALLNKTLVCSMTQKGCRVPIPASRSRVWGRILFNGRNGRSRCLLVKEVCTFNC